MKNEIVLDPKNPKHAAIIKILRESKEHDKSHEHQQRTCNCCWDYRARRR